MTTANPLYPAWVAGEPRWYWPTAAVSVSDPFNTTRAASVDTWARTGTLDDARQAASDGYTRGGTVG